MQINTIEKLEWDSTFFGYPVAKITLDQEGSDKLDTLFQQLESEKFRLTYLFVPPSERELINRITRKGSLLVDQKTAYSKTTEKHDQFHNNIVEFQESEINERLIELVLQAGIYSRFNIDENFNDKEYEKLYIEWLTKSIKKQIAIKTFVARRLSELIGITTLDEKALEAEIGLVAVDRNFQRQGIGNDLIHTADTKACEMGLNRIKVVTQLTNKAACKLYENCHFHVEKITNIYHYWQK